jgi:hypothetical protein
MKKSAPPGWSPSEITRRTDGYFVDPENPDRIPRAAAEMIVAARFGGDSISDVRARMIAREHALKRTFKRRRAIEARMVMVRRDA